MPFHIDDLPAEQIKAALALDTGQLPEDRAWAIQDFLERIGGRENAMMAVETLGQLEGSNGDFRRQSNGHR